MKTIFLFLAVICFIIISCEEKKAEPFLVISNNIDEMVDWSCKSSVIREGKAHSGKYLTFIDSKNPYSITFEKKLTDITNRKISKIHFQAWGKVVDLYRNVDIVCSIESNNKKIIYRSVSFNKKIKIPNVWTLVQGEFKIPANIPDNSIIKLYIWSSNSDTGEADDFEIKLIY